MANSGSTMFTKIDMLIDYYIFFIIIYGYLRTAVFIEFYFETGLPTTFIHFYILFNIFS